MPLSDTAIRQAKAAPRPIKLFDERGLFLLLNPSGSRYWRFKYRIDGKEKLLALGVYPDVSLKLARDRRDEARRLVANGVDPGAKRQAEKLSKTDTFEAIAREWLALQEHQLSPTTFKKARWTFETLLFPRLGDRPIKMIKAPDLLTALRKIEARGTYETTHRAKQRCGQIFRYAIATGRGARYLRRSARCLGAGRDQESCSIDRSCSRGRVAARDRRLPRRSDDRLRIEVGLSDLRSARRAALRRMVRGRP